MKNIKNIIFIASIIASSQLLPSSTTHDQYDGLYIPREQCDELCQEEKDYLLSIYETNFERITRYYYQTNDIQEIDINIALLEKSDLHIKDLLKTNTQKLAQRQALLNNKNILEYLKSDAKKMARFKEQVDAITKFTNQLKRTLHANAQYTKLFREIKNNLIAQMDASSDTQQ